jgi:hypothetical protein
VIAGVLAGYVVIFLFLAWSYIRIITTGPGRAIDVSPTSDHCRSDLKLIFSVSSRLQLPTGILLSLSNPFSPFLWVTTDRIRSRMVQQLSRVLKRLSVARQLDVVLRMKRRAAQHAKSPSSHRPSTPYTLSCLAKIP